MNDGQLDIAISRLLGKPPLGEAPCWRDPETGAWNVCCFGNSKETQFVYLAHCVCDTLEPDEFDHAKYFGHDSACLEVVPFYHLDDRLARQALEQVCDERGLSADALYNFRDGGVWAVEILGPGICSLEKDKSFPLAVARALVGLENEE